MRVVHNCLGQWSTIAFGSPLMVQLSPHNRHVIVCTLKKKSRDRWIRLSVLAPQSPAVLMLVGYRGAGAHSDLYTGLEFTSYLSGLRCGLDARRFAGLRRTECESYRKRSVARRLRCRSQRGFQCALPHDGGAI